MNTYHLSVSYAKLVTFCNNQRAAASCVPWSIIGVRTVRKILSLHVRMGILQQMDKRV
jgi:hypothetical protein